MSPQYEQIYKSTIIKAMAPRGKYSRNKLGKKVNSNTTIVNQILEQLKKQKFIKEELISNTKGFKPKIYRKYYSLTEKGYQEQLKLKGII